jgi:hypothetical protein
MFGGVNQRVGRSNRWPGPALAAFAVALVVATGACGSDGPDHTAPPVRPSTHESVAQALARLRHDDVRDAPPPSETESAMGDMDMKGPHPEHRIRDAAERARRDHQLAAARRVASQYPHLRDAVAAGYVVTPFREPGVGVHAVNWSLVGQFAPARPAMLLYDGLEPDATLVALSYYIQSAAGRQPDGFAGPDDHWHNHVDICIAGGKLLATVHQPRECSANAGVYLTGRNLWMLHAWVVPGHHNRWGVFATYNPDLDDHSDAST